MGGIVRTFTRGQYNSGAFFLRNFITLTGIALINPTTFGGRAITIDNFYMIRIVLGDNIDTCISSSIFSMKTGHLKL